MSLSDQLRALAKEAAIRSVPKLLQTAASEGIKATRKQAEEALAESVPRQVLRPPPRSNGKAYTESPQSRYSCDLIDFSQNTAKPGYICVLMQTWSRKIWAAPQDDKTPTQTNIALQKLLEEANPKPNLTHDLIHDAGMEWSRVRDILPENWVERAKDPLDTNGIATLDKGIQSLKQGLESIIEEDSGDWRTHLKQATMGYNRTFNSAVIGPPNSAENGSSREFLITQQNAMNMAANDETSKKRLEAVQKTEHFREATGAKRSFNPQYGPKLHLEEAVQGKQYIKGSDDLLHLLKRVIPIPTNSGEPKGRLTQPRQYLSDTLRDLAEDVHAELIGAPRRLLDLSYSLDPKLQRKEAKIRTREFIRKFTDLFRIEGSPEVVHALVLSLSQKARSERTIEVQPLPAPRRQMREEPPRNYQEGGSSASGVNPVGPSASIPVSASAGNPLAAFTSAQQRRSDPVSQHIMSYKSKRTPAQVAVQDEKKRQDNAERQRKQNERLDKAVQAERQKQQKQLEQLMKRNR